MELTDKVKYGKLLDLYSGLLTEKQRYTLEGYLLYDLSLSEMAQTQNLTRQAVFDTIQKTLKLLNEYENKMGLLRRANEITLLLESLSVTNTESAQIIEKIKNLL